MEFDASRLTGLSEAEAAERLRQEGYNELPSGGRRAVWSIALEVVKEPMFLMLVACGGLYLLMGKEHFGDAALLLSFVFVVMGITIVQERRTERALEALKDLSAPRALVIREGVQRRIAGREVARGDVVIVSEGDRVPADAVLLHSINLSADESLLTGESVPVRKTARTGATGAMGRPGGDDQPFLYSGSLVTRGQGIAEILATGPRTELGKIGKALESVKPEETLLQKETGLLIRNLAALGLAFCILAVVVYGLTRGNNLRAWEEGLLAGLTMAMATLPEEFPVVLTVFLALGAWRISQNRVLTRRMPAIETLGAATVLCVDKTGTLTLNRMSVRQLWVPDELYDDAADGVPPALPEAFHELLEYGILACKHDPFDPMEKALREIGQSRLQSTEHLHESWTLIHEYPLSPNLLALSHVWKSPEGADYVIAAKGAPEAIFDLCHLDEAETNRIALQVTAMANDGLRVLGAAKTRFQQTGLPPAQHDLPFQFVGLIGLADPVRPGVAESIRECYTAGIRVIMITGDYPGTAQNIARQIGLRNPEEVITGSELDRMPDEELARRIRTANLFARAVPEQKMRIVNALKANREIVAMTGDGVNDAPALKSAHIGVAMGARGTDVAREASSLVLLDDSFSSIVAAVKMGRRIFDNIKKAVAYIFAVHVPIAGLSMIPVFLKDWPLILLPVHVVFLELIIDPACSIIFEAEQAEPNVMTRPPRKADERLFGLRSILLSLLQGFSVLLVLLGVFIAARTLGHGDDSSRGLTFMTLVVANLCLILTNRSQTRTILSMFQSPNKALWWVVSGACVFLALVLLVPFLRGVFHFAPLHSIDMVICLVAGFVAILWFEAMKVIGRRRAKRTPRLEPSEG
ncbi:MAG: cation-translocating P-type ATPase [Candidatus Sumerlaeota bacterium]|nr:cation-translocating P-type ATPase [Candidatus Sumerlaeota bacterium]